MFRGFVFRSFLFAVLCFAILRPSRFYVSKFCVRGFVFRGFVFAVFNVDPLHRGRSLLTLHCVAAYSLHDFVDTRKLTPSSAKYLRRTHSGF